ncbi:glutamyl aminopeptidase-like [Armigeres subalbatus]|uniref:glutamyl aminopeptidase-like n=1 Tax=Armigeres subalbatus TaxID=124917 RepID=UPI002ED6A934
MIFIHFLCAVISLLATGIVADRTTYRLPDSTFPVHYTLRIEMNPDLGSASNYSGSVAIIVNVHYPTDAIVLHADASLEIEQIVIWNVANSEPINIQSVEREAATQFLKIYTDRTMNQIEQYVLGIDFNGYLLRGGNQGFFLNSYQNEFEEDFYAVTAFEPTHARKAFPCYDEPMFKATFDVEIVCGRDYSVHSNAEPVDVELMGEDKQLVRFERTPPMASYLIAFMISKFDEEVREFDGLRLGMITRPDEDRSGDLEFAFQATRFAVDALQSYTGQRYSFLKLDQVAIDGFNGGLENWGLILYATDLLIVDPAADSWERVDSALLITHEVAHQFFGNLVGLPWWEHLWMKEGFATFMSYKLSLQFLPDARDLIKQQFYNDIWDAMYFDSGPTTYPMSHYVESPEAIGALYQKHIVYSKAAGIIRMMENAVGSDVLEAAVQNYIINHRFGTANPYKLYLSLDKFVGYQLPPGVHVGEIFHSWAAQAGHPIIHVERIGESDRYRLTQHPFGSCDCEGSRWWIPIFYTSYDVGERFAGWMPDTTDTVTVVMGGFLPLVNNRWQGFFRVSYSQQGWNEILNNWNSIDGDSRAKLIDDAFGLLWNLENTTEPLIEMLARLKTENDPLPWMAAMADHNLWKLVQLVKGRSNVESNVLQLARNLTRDMLSIFRDDMRGGSIAARRTALLWEERIHLIDNGRVEKSELHCPQMLSSQQLTELRCKAQPLVEMLNSVDVAMCFGGPEEYRQFLDNLLRNFKCPEVWNVILILLEKEIPFVDSFLQSLIDELSDMQNSVDPEPLEDFLKGATFFIYKPEHQQLYQKFVDSLEVISEVQRSNVKDLLDVQRNRVAGIIQALQEANRSM